CSAATDIAEGYRATAATPAGSLSPLRGGTRHTSKVPWPGRKELGPYYCWGRSAGWRVFRRVHFAAHGGQVPPTHDPPALPATPSWLALAPAWPGSLSAELEPSAAIGRYLTNLRLAGWRAATAR